MLEQPPYLVNILKFCELIALVVSFFYYNSVKKTYWKWFILYLIYINFYEIIFLKIIKSLHLNGEYFAFIQIPLEFLFLFWLYAYKSLSNKKLFVISVIIYLFSLIPDLSLSRGNFYFSSFNYIIGALILLIMIVLEFNKQIKSESILLFSQNKMFYINIGVVLMYVGTLPFFGLFYPIMKVPEIWNSYYIYFMVSNCLMYLLFAASFIWGKVKS